MLATAPILGSHLASCGEPVIVMKPSEHPVSFDSSSGYEPRRQGRGAECGWARGKADVLYVADAFAVMEKVNALLAAAKPEG